jgi:hypothetical protein
MTKLMSCPQVNRRRAAKKPAARMVSRSVKSGRHQSSHPLPLPSSPIMATTSGPPKKKRPDDQIVLEPATGQKPVQLQRRRVWRACESCRLVRASCATPSAGRNSTQRSSTGGRRSNATATSRHARNVRPRDLSAPGCRRKIGPH